MDEKQPKSKVEIEMFKKGGKMYMKGSKMKRS